MKNIVRNMKSIIMLALCALILVSCTDEKRMHTLKIYNWADYIDESVLDEFKEWYKAETGEDVEIVYQLFDINEVMLAKIEKGHEDYDVACPSEYIIERMLRNDLLLPIDKDFGTTPNYIDRNLSPYIKDCFSKIDGSGKNANDYAVGYMWGTTGFMYNTKFVEEEEVSTWTALTNPRFKNRIFVKDAFRDVYSTLLTMLRQDDIKSGKLTYEKLMYDSSDESIKLVEDYLKSAKDNVAGWEADFGKEEMTKGKAWINLTWSGDAAWAIEEAADVDVELKYTVPKEGSNVWFDGWVIPRYAKNVKAARYFINFLCRSDIALRNMDEIGYVSAIGTQEVLNEQNDPETYEEAVDASYFFGEGADSVHLWQVQYPDASVINRCAMMHDSGPRTEQMLAMWSRVKGDNASPVTAIVIFLAVVGFAVYGINKKRKRHKKNSW
ncbi:MAG: ABC transporter substrate-binding protein [Bacteroidaceae bacterium]|nr:ABC transporter substrate-binding protein [Bacteroidaceae bacterium]